jgi:enoyl-CoA hydratase/carnithine racemase
MSVRVTEPQPGVVTALLDRPEKLNALDMAMVSGIRGALSRAGISVLILGSTTNQAFSAGADLDLSDPERAAVSDALYELYQEMRESDVIVVAAARGHAVGGGAQLLIASDLRIVGHDVSIRFAGPAHGLTVGAWGLPSLVGRGRALELCLSMREVGAAEALAIGLVERVADDPIGQALDLASHLTRLHRDAVTAVKRVVAVVDPSTALDEERHRNSGWGGSVHRPGGERS